MRTYRWAFVGAVLVAGPYACSSSSGGVTAGVDAGAEASTATTPDAAISSPDAAPSAACSGNPIAFDGGVPDAAIEASVPINPALDQNDVRAMLWTDELGGQIVYTAFEGIMRTEPDGGVRAPVMMLSPGDTSAGLVESNGVLYTAISRFNGGGYVLETSLLHSDTVPTTFVSTDDSSGVMHPASAVAVHSNGTIYFVGALDGDAGVYGWALFRMTVQFTATVIDTFPVDDAPVSLVLSSDQKALFALHQTTRPVVKYAVDGDGSVSNPTPVPLEETARADALAIDRAGNFYVGGFYGGIDPGIVDVFDPTGTTRWGRYVFPYYPTALAFGGPDRTTLYVATQDKDSTGYSALYALPTLCPGY